ncbi:hypothetical protein [Belliella baltica]|uniref:hypothetical protein n=1 Tax=Belliella baltica TaxID=232259 RepID=UPI0012FA732E|nr:hypothetical protein [Belliella baltica]
MANLSKPDIPIFMKLFSSLDWKTSAIVDHVHLIRDLHDMLVKMIRYQYPFIFHIHFFLEDPSHYLIHISNRCSATHDSAQNSA